MSQIRTAKFGVRDEEGRLAEAKLQALAEMSEIKMIDIKLFQMDYIQDCLGLGT